jgi:hypothetical protein
LVAVHKPEEMQKMQGQTYLWLVLKVPGEKKEKNHYQSFFECHYCFDNL